MLIEPQPKCILGYTGDKPRRLSRGKPLLGLARKLGVLQFRRQDEAATIPNIFRRELHASGEQIAQFTKLPHGIEQPRSQTVNVRATLRSGNQVHIGLCHDLATFWQPLDCPVHRFGLTFEMSGKRRFGNDRKVDRGVCEVISNAVLVVPLRFFLFLLIGQRDPQPRAQYCLGA